MPDQDWISNAKVSFLIRRKARKLSRSRGFSRSDQPDIEQEFSLLLHKQSARFDPARAKAETFASRIIDNRARSLLREARTQKCGFGLTQYLSDVVGHETGTPVLLEATVDDSAGRRHTGQRQRSQTELAQLKLDLSDANKTLAYPAKDLAALMSHVSQFAAAEVLGISRRQAAALVAKLRALYEERGLSA